MTINSYVPALTQVKIGEYTRYEDAERAVDLLADRKFPVEYLTLVGCDLRLVERVMGRLSWGRVALSGLGTGAWIGLLVGLLVSVWATSTTGAFAVMLGSAGYGALFGAAFALIAYALMRGRHDYVSSRQIVPSRFELLATPEHADRARDMLAELP